MVYYPGMTKKPTIGGVAGMIPVPKVSTTQTPTTPKAPTPTSPVPVPGNTLGGVGGVAMNVAQQAKVPVPQGDYWDKNYGGSNKYANDQQDRYTEAVNSGNTTLANGLLSDSKRVGYTLTGPNAKFADTAPVPVPGGTPDTFTAPIPTVPVPAYTPAVPVMDEAAIRKYAEDQTARKLSDAKLTADQAINSNKLTAQQQSDALKANYDKMYTTINEDRGVENVTNARRLSPFSGKSDYALGEIERNRARFDGENQSTLQTNQGNIAAQSALLQQQINDKYTALQNAAPDEREALFQSIKNDERNYDLMVHGTLRDDAQANSQLNNTAFNQALQSFQTNYGVKQDQIQNDAQYGGTYGGNPTFAAQQAKIQNDAQFAGTYGGNLTVGQRQQIADNKFRIGQATGTLSNGQQTLDNKQFQEGIRQDDRNYDRGVFESDRGYDRGVYQDDRNYNYGVGQDEINNGFKQDSSDLNWAQEDRLGNSQSQSADTVSGATAGEFLNNSLKKVVGIDPMTGQQKFGVVNDPVTREKAFIDAWNTSGVAPGKDTIEMLTKAGYTTQEIASLKTKYPSAFSSGGSSSGYGSPVKTNVPQQYQSLISSTESKYGLPEGILGVLADTESNFNPNAKNGKSGASGMFQFMPATAEGYGIDPFNVNQAADAAGKMLSGLAAKYDGDYAKALAGYNWGGGNVDKAIKKYGANWLDHAPKETRDYIKKILG